MEFLTHLASPQSIDHFHLMIVVLGVVSAFYIPYLAFLTGFSGLSVYFARRGRNEQSTVFSGLAKKLIRAALADVKMMVFLGVIPSLSMLFLFSQLLQSTEAISVSLLFFASLSLGIGAILLYSYRFTYGLSALLSSVERSIPDRRTDLTVAGEVAEARSINEQRSRRFGFYGMLFLLLTACLTMSALAVTADTGSWSSVGTVFDLMLSAGVWVHLLQFLSIVPGITGITLLLMLSRNTMGFARGEDEEAVFTRRLAIRLAVVSLLAQPLILMLTYAVLPAEVYTTLVFTLGSIALILFFLAAHFVYASFKFDLRQYSPYAFATLVAAVALLMVQNQVAVGTASRAHAASMEIAYERAMEEFRSKLGLSLNVVTGADIYSGRCSACHLPDARKVGPPFKYVADKYKGKLDALEAFIRNPVKVNPDYPSMPNQGLKPAEIDSIAHYVLRTFGQ